jgi:hypothetical protein
VVYLSSRTKTMRPLRSRSLSEAMACWAISGVAYSTTPHTPHHTTHDAHTQREATRARWGQERREVDSQGSSVRQGAAEKG